MLQTIQQAVKIHDRFQIEIKLDYELSASRKTRYHVATYIFVPQSLGIDPHSYSKTDFYRDIQSYIRLKTPPFILRDFIEVSTSPLNKLKEITRTENWANDPQSKERVIIYLKFLSAMFKSATREHFNLIEKRVKEARPDSSISLIINNLVEEFIAEGEKIISSYRQLYAVFNLPNVERDLFIAYKLTDESLSLLIEESAIEMYQVVEKYIQKKDDKNQFQECLRGWVRNETKYRKSVGYKSILLPDNDNETYVFRASVLKKYAASVLHLAIAVKPEGIGLEHVLFAFAAGISMVFATVIAFYFQDQFGNLTFPFFVALIVGYMFTIPSPKSKNGQFSAIFD
jgi:hypothetical protein